MKTDRPFLRNAPYRHLPSRIDAPVLRLAGSDERFPGKRRGVKEAQRNR